MKKYLLPIFLLFPVLLSAQTIRYVKRVASGNAQGSSWINAANDLQGVIENSQPGDTIYVAAGTYVPMRDVNTLEVTPNNRNNAFILKKGVTILGGFPATGLPKLSDRNPKLHKTILSGEMGDLTKREDNAYNVVVAAGDESSGTLDGFTITGGYADDAYGSSYVKRSENRTWHGYGGGIHSLNSSPTFRNLVVENNFAVTNAGGALIQQYANNPIACIVKIYNSSFINNECTTNGAGLMVSDINFDMVNCLVANNKAEGYKTGSAGGMMITGYNKNVNIINTTIANNFGYRGNGGLYLLNDLNVVLANSIIYGNYITITDYTNVNLAKPHHTTILNSVNNIISGSVNPFTDSDNKDYTIRTGTPAYNKGDNSYYDFAVYGGVDLNGNPRKVGSSIDIGPYENQVDDFASGLTNNILYVRKGATGRGDGSSWENAMPELADALRWAKQEESQWTSSNVLQIWVAKGKYVPKYPAEGAPYSGDRGRENTFLLVNNTQLYGGFSGTETSLEQRNVSANETVLSGDVGAANVATDNVHNVVLAFRLSDLSRLDGFTISDGNSVNLPSRLPTVPVLSNVPILRNSGAGIASYQSSFTIANCKIIDNIAEVDGGGIYFYGRSSSQISAKLVNCLIANNTGANGVYLMYSNVDMLNTTVSKNSSLGVYLRYDHIFNMNNSILYGNVGANLSSGSNSGTIKNSFIGFDGSFNTAWGTNGGGNVVNTTNPFKDADNRDYRLASSATHIINKGNNSLYSTQNYGNRDLAGNNRFVGTIDMGAYESIGTNLPAPTANANQEFCADNELTLSHLTVTKNNGATLNWYASATAIQKISPETLLTDNATYYVSQTDGVNESTRMAITVTERPTINIFLGSSSPITCFNGNNGMLSLVVSGGQAPYVYSWDKSASTTATATDLIAGQHKFTVTDANGCFASATFTVTQPAELEATITVNNISANGQTNGRATVTVTGGTSPYTYLWSNGQIGATATNLAEGIYTVTITDANGCTLTKSVKVDGPPAKPSNVVAEGFDRHNIISWTANTDADLAYYKLSVSVDNGPRAEIYGASRTETSFTHTGLTNGTGYTYSLIAVDSVGNESVFSDIAHATPKSYQTITFDTLADKVYGDADFDPAATSTSGLEPTYTSSNTAVATIVNNKVRIVGVGTTTITASQTGNSVYKPAVDKQQTLSVTKKVLTATSGAVTKVYDGTTAATIVFDALTGLVGNDNVGVDYTSAAYNNINVGDDKAITIVGLSLTGPAKDNYSLNPFTVTGSITAKLLTATAEPITKIYDGTTTATVSFNPLTDLEGEDEVSVNYTSATYSDKHAGTNKAITVLGLELVGTAKSNYSLNPFVTTGVITQKPLNVMSQTDNKVYDGTIVSGVAPVTDALATGDNITTQAVQVFDTKHVGTGKTITVSGLIINDGNNGANYAVNYLSNSTGAITSKPLNVTAQSDTKVYDGTTSSGIAPVVDALAIGDNITTHPVQAYDGKHVGEAKTITASGLVINDGNSGNNYDVSYISNSTGVITAKPLTVTAQSDSKEYDGTTKSDIAPLVDGLETGDQIATFPSQSYDNSNVGTAKTMIPSGLVINDGNNGANYSITFINNTNGEITPASLSYVATAATKVYGEANPSFTGTVTGFVSGDDQANATAGTLAFTTSANNTSGIGTYAITGSGLTAQNYVFEQAASNATAFTITARPVTITAEAKTKTYGDADPALTFQITSGNLVNGDNFTGNLTRAAGEDAGTYSINQNSVALSPNYDLSYQSATLTIDKAILTVIANAAERCYGDNNPAFGVSYSGFKYNDNENSLRSKPTVGTTANAGSVAGDYALIPDGGISDNYIFDYHSGTLSINPLPVNTISSDKGNSISRGETAVLTVNSDNGTTYCWSSSAGIISGENSAMLTVRPMQTTTYTVTVTNANGCESSSSFTLEVKGDYQAVDAENFITPNGDGVNDTWVVKNIDAYPDHTLTIVDRAGRQVYQTRNYKNDWNGTLEGSPLAPGTYYYILRFDEPGAQYFRGFITIVRQ